MWKVARGVSHPWRRTSNAAGVAATSGGAGAGAGGGGGGGAGGAGVTAGDVERKQERRQLQAARDLERDRNLRRSHGLARQASRSGSRKRDKVLIALAGLLFFVVLFVLVDVMKKRRIKTEELWDRLYMRAVISDSYNWQLGWRLEDLTRQATNQRARLVTMVKTLDQLPARPQGPALPLAAKMAAWVGGGKEG
ncbi:unnamed protein product, partial [Laminaria digitata]